LDLCVHVWSDGLEGEVSGAVLFKNACRIYTEWIIDRYLMSNAVNRTDPTEKAERHIQLCKWERAPRQLRKYVEKEIALAWWLLGLQSARKEALEMQNEDMREIIRIAGEKVRGG
jgi:hypothetical protein